jgi:hypothetical protein
VAKGFSPGRPGELFPAARRVRAAHGGDVQARTDAHTCPVNNLYEATTFLLWALVAACLVYSGCCRACKFLGAFASPVLFTVGVFALMPSLDPPHGPKPDFSNWLTSLHAATILQSYGAFGLGAVAAGMFLMQQHDLKFHKLRAVLSLLPSIQRLELITTRLCSWDLFFDHRPRRRSQLPRPGASYFPIRRSSGRRFWLVYLELLVARLIFRPLPAGGSPSASAFVFLLLTFWITNLIRPAPSMNVVVIGLSHRTSPVELRERFAFAEAKIPGALKSLRDSGIASEAVILSTCNRVEIYAATPLEPAKGVCRMKKFLPDHHAFDGRWRRTLHARRAAKFAAPVQGRVRPRFDGARRDGNPRPAQGRLRTLAHARHTGARLNKAFQRAFQRRQAHPHRTPTSSAAACPSMSVAVELAERFSVRWPNARCWSSARAKRARRPRARCFRAAQKASSSPTVRTNARGFWRGIGRARRAVRRLGGGVRAH